MRKVIISIFILSILALAYSAESEEYYEDDEDANEEYYYVYDSGPSVRAVLDQDKNNTNVVSRSKIKIKWPTGNSSKIDNILWPHGKPSDYIKKKPGPKPATKPSTPLKTSTAASPVNQTNKKKPVDDTTPSSKPNKTTSNLSPGVSDNSSSNKGGASSTTSTTSTSTTPATSVQSEKPANQTPNSLNDGLSISILESLLDQMSQGQYPTQFPLKPSTTSTTRPPTKPTPTKESVRTTTSTLRPVWPSTKKKRPQIDSNWINSHTSFILEKVQQSIANRTFVKSTVPPKKNPTSSSTVSVGSSSTSNIISVNKNQENYYQSTSINTNMQMSDSTKGTIPTSDKILTGTPLNSRPETMEIPKRNNSFNPSTTGSTQRPADKLVTVSSPETVQQKRPSSSTRPTLETITVSKPQTTTTQPTKTYASSEKPTGTTSMYDPIFQSLLESAKKRKGNRTTSRPKIPSTTSPPRGTLFTPVTKKPVFINQVSTYRPSPKTTPKRAPVNGTTTRPTFTVHQQKKPGFIRPNQPEFSESPLDVLIENPPDHESENVGEDAKEDPPDLIIYTPIKEPPVNQPVIAEEENHLNFDRDPVIFFLPEAPQRVGVKTPTKKNSTPRPKSKSTTKPPKTTKNSPKTTTTTQPTGHIELKSAPVPEPIVYRVPPIENIYMAAIDHANPPVSIPLPIATSQLNPMSHLPANTFQSVAPFSIQPATPEARHKVTGAPLTYSVTSKPNATPATTTTTRTPEFKNPVPLQVITSTPSTTTTSTTSTTTSTTSRPEPRVPATSSPPLVTAPVVKSVTLAPDSSQSVATTPSFVPFLSFLVIPAAIGIYALSGSSISRMDSLAESTDALMAFGVMLVPAFALAYIIKQISQASGKRQFGTSPTEFLNHIISFIEDYPYQD